MTPAMNLLWFVRMFFERELSPFFPAHFGLQPRSVDTVSTFLCRASCPNPCFDKFLCRMGRVLHCSGRRAFCDYKSLFRPVLLKALSAFHKVQVSKIRQKFSCHISRSHKCQFLYRPEMSNIFNRAKTGMNDSAGYRRVSFTYLFPAYQGGQGGSAEGIYFLLSDGRILVGLSGSAFYA